MIKLQRQPKPGVITSNENHWVADLKKAISLYGGYAKIPKELKDSLISHYKHDDIKASLFNSSFQKCAFCETKPAESGNIEVEHYAPKSKYPALTFNWENLLPACRKCNGSKDDHDALMEPIVNPYDVDPEDVFYYQDIKISAKDNQHKALGELTIRVCGLNSVRLMKPRADILVSLHGFCESIEHAVQDYYTADTEIKKINRRRKIREALESIEILATPSEKFSGFCKSYLSKCEPYNKAKEIVAEESN